MTRRQDEDEYEQPVQVYAPIHGTGTVSTDGADVLRITRSRVMIGDDNTARERHHYTIERSGSVTTSPPRSGRRTGTGSTAGSSVAR